jgi:outer membrane lipoprotein-sorting protein
MRRYSIILVTTLSLMLFVMGCGKDKDAAKAPMAQEFSATMVSTSAGQKVTMNIYMKPNKFRTDTSVAGSSTIVRKDLNKVWTIMTAQKAYMEMAGMTDAQPPLMVEEKVKGEVSRKKIGSETVNGHPSTKYEVTAKTDDKVTQIHQWWATDIHFPVKTAAVDGSWSMEYRDIKIGSQPDSLFEVPAGYKKMSIPGMPGDMKIKIPGMNAK